MFDYIKVEMKLPDNPPPPEGIEWFQTKDVPDFLFMNKWMIRADGRLVKFGVRYEDRSDPNAEGIMRLVGSMTSIPVPEEDKVFDDFHGDLSFGHYDGKTGEDWEYTARFTDGVCSRITLEYTPTTKIRDTR